MKKKAPVTISVILLSALSVFDIFVNIARFLYAENPGADSTRTLIVNGLPMLLCSVTMVVIALYYLLFSYRTPHGNMLRYIILVFAIYHILPVASVLKEGVNMSVYVYLVAAVLVAFMGGRLSKFKKNAVIMAIVLALYIFNVIYLAKDPVGAGLIGRLSQWYIINEPVIWAVLCCSYAIRYNDHKNAGLEEKIRLRKRQNRQNKFAEVPSEIVSGGAFFIPRSITKALDILQVNNYNIK